MPSVSDRSWRVLVAPLVYNGEEFFAPCLSSLGRLQPGSHSVDVLVLDDAGTTPGWSDRCREMAVDLGFEYYRAPRNLGIPRSMNLAMQRAVDAAYDAVVLLNSDAVVPSNLIPTLIGPLTEDRSVSSTSAWSNDPGIYSIPTTDSDCLRENPDIVDWISDRLNEEFDGHAVVIPTGAGFCTAFATAMIDDVGLMDPVFTNGYSAEIDWCLRGHTLGYQSALVPSCFAYRAHSRMSQVQNLVGDADRMNRTRQAIIGERYPQFASQLAAFSASGIIDDLRERGLHRIVTSAARQHGYRLETSRLRQRSDDIDGVRFRIDPDGVVPTIMASYQGFEATFTVGEGGALLAVETIVGQPPREVRIFDRGPVSREIEAEVGTSGAIPLSRSPYRERVF